MKNEKASKLQDKKNTDATGKKAKSTNGTSAASAANASEKAKAKSGRGLSNEGTVVSYDADR